MKKQGYVIASLVTVLCMLLTLLPIGLSGLASGAVGAAQWVTADSDTDTWEYTADGNLHHTPGNGLGIEFGVDLDLTKALKVEFDFSFNKEEILKAWPTGEPRPYLVVYLRSQDLNPEQCLAIGIKGPGLWVVDNHWFMEPSYNNGSAWLPTPATSVDWINAGDAAPVLHLVIERVAGENTINLKATVGDVIISNANMHIENMDDLLALTNARLCFKQDQLLDKMDITISNLSVINDGVQLVKEDTVANTTTTTAGGSSPHTGVPVAGGVFALTTLAAAALMISRSKRS